MLDHVSIDALRTQAVLPQHHLTGGAWTTASDDATRNVYTPIDGSLITPIAQGNAANVDAAVAAAKRAFEDGRWSGMGPGQRKKILQCFADLIQRNTLEMAVLGARDNGTEIGMANKAEPGSAKQTIRFYADAIDKVSGEITPTPDGTLALVHRDPIGMGTEVGAVHSEVQLAQNVDFVGKAEAEGTARLTGGERILAETGGTYMSPAVFDNVSPEATIFRQEVNGPVLAVTPFDIMDEAIALAIATDFGLAGAIWTSNVSAAHRVTTGIKSGMLHVNPYGGPDVAIPKGGMKQSRNGVDKPLHALDKYVGLKFAWIKSDG